MWSHKGVSLTNETAALVYEYNSKKALSKIGYRFDSDSLSAFDMAVFCFIASEYSRLEAQDIKKARKR